MPKKIIQDVVPPEGKSIRNIPLPPGRKTRNLFIENIPAKKKEEPVIENGNNHFDKNTQNKNGKGRRKWIWSIAIVCIVLLIFSSFSLFTSATVTITPKQQDLSIKQSLNAKNTPDGELQFDVIKISKEIGKQVPATGEETIEKKASGEIIIYNKFGPQTQRLIKNTRFETPEGLIYKITDSIDVPGTTTKDGETVPGSIKVTVYAEFPGEKYNVGLKDFTVPGFKGDPRYNGFYARSNTPMVGGFSGAVKKVTESVLESTKKEIESSLKTELLANAHAQVSEDFVLYDNSLFIRYEDLPQSDVKENSVKINRRGTLYGVVFNKKDLSRHIASKSMTEEKQDDVIISNIDSLSFNIKNKELVNPDKISEFEFSVEGTGKLLWLYDPEAIAKDLSGKSKKDFDKILSNYESVKKASLVMRPFWKKTFPKKVEKIRVEGVI